MRVMVMMKGETESEAGAHRDEKFVTEMMQYSEELVKAGVILAGARLHPSSKGARVKFSGGKTTGVDGPSPRRANRPRQTHPR